MSNSIINLGELSKPIDTLINKISDATGVLFEPTRIRRKAKAEADAKITIAKADAIVRNIELKNNLKLQEISKRALQRVVREEVIKQENIENIILKAIPYITSSAKSEDIDNDWLLKFFDKSKYISNEKMQEIWGKILAGEANKPGNSSRKTLDIVEELDQNDASFFQNLMLFTFYYENVDPIIFIYDIDNKIYSDRKVYFSILKHLSILGLISFDNMTNYFYQKMPQTYDIVYGNNKINIKHNKPENNKLEYGKVMLSQYGEELFRIFERKFDEEILKYTVEKIKKQNIVVKVTKI